MLKTIFIFVLFFACKLNGQYSVAYVLKNRNNIDTFYTKTGVSDTLYQKFGQNYFNAGVMPPIQEFPISAIVGLQSVFNNKLDASNIKTINGQSIVGTGNLSVGAVDVLRVFLPSDVVNGNAVANTIADVTSLSFPVIANTTYRFKFFIIYSSAATTTGSRWCINGPATTFLHYYSNYTLSATSITTNQGLKAYNLPAASNASSLTSGNIAIIEGVIRPSANGTVIARFASEVALSSVTAIGDGRSYVEYEIIN